MNATVNFYSERTAVGRVTNSARVVVNPQAAVNNGSVFVALNGRAKKVPVTVSGATAQGAMIQSGLIGGEDLIVDAPADLKDGQRIQFKQ
jgi:HlyD family secretion protein